jgi:hypothetical protein
MAVRQAQIAAETANIETSFLLEYQRRFGDKNTEFQTGSGAVQDEQDSV